MKKTHYILYVTSVIWDVTVCWPAVLLIRLFWGTNLHWERNPDDKVKDGWSLFCELKPDSWPARTWYRFKTDGKYTELPERLHATRGKWKTWGGTTLGHGGFYGPGVLQVGKWVPVQTHEHKHTEQFEASMLRAFIVGSLFAIVIAALGHPVAALVAFLVHWWMGYWWMGLANWLTAFVRGEDPYRGSQHEEAAYDAAKETHG